MSSFRDFLIDRGRSQRFALALAMTGVRMGERLLMVGDNAALAAQLAAKVGLTGRSVVVVGSEAAAARAAASAAGAGVLFEAITVAALPALPVEDDAFDVAVLSAGRDVLAGLDDSGRSGLAVAVGRALRAGGRIVVVEGQPKGPLALFRPQPAGLAAFRAAGGAIALLETAGFHPVRVLADREGQRFTEGLKR